LALLEATTIHWYIWWHDDSRSVIGRFPLSIFGSLLSIELISLLLFRLMPVDTAQSVLAKVRARDPHQDEFMQAVEEVLLSLKPVLAKNPAYCKVLERLCEPERMLMFR
jgi:hypothetical protein